MADIHQKFHGTLADDYQKGREAARRGVPKWKSPEYYDERKRNAWDAGHNDETSGARPPGEVRSNMPEPTSPADIVAMHATNLLNDDEIKRDALSQDGRQLDIRGVKLQWDEGVALIVVHPVTGAASLGYSYVSPKFREVFFEAANNWHQRRRDELCRPLADKIAKPPPPPLPPLPPTPPKPTGLLQRFVMWISGEANPEQKGAGG